MKTCQGSCHCGAVRFEADIDLSQPTLRCNCSFCLKIRCWSAPVAPSAFRLLAGEEQLTPYRFGAGREVHLFCRHCGVRPYGIADSPRRGRFYGVSVTCLDNLSADEMAQLSISYVDGANDLWDAPPNQIRHL